MPAVFEAAASPLGWMGSEKGAREVFLCARPRTGLPKALERKRATLVLVPTARHLTPALRERHAPGAVVELEALEESIVALGGRLVRCAAIAPDAPEIAVRAQDPSIRLVGLAKRWGEMRLCLLDSMSLRIDVGGRCIRCTYVDLGMAHPRTRRPTLAWEVLEEILENGGFFHTSRLGNANATKQLIHRLSLDLQKLFGIQGSPFHRYRADCGWRARFLARKDLPEDM